MAAPKSRPSAERGAAGDLSQTLPLFLQSRLTPGDSLCVALSGGRDSVVLLHALRQLAPSLGLSALHVHHGLSADADDWAAFCVALCRDWGIPLQVQRVEVPRASGLGLEAAARALRHECFAHCGAPWLALAHHRDDQAETVLLNLLRGAGVDGARGMAVERAHAHLGVRIVRPLLDTPRSALDAYAAAHGLTWIDDESNRDTAFRRNYLRHEITPRLAARFPGAQAALARAAAHFGEAAELLDELAVADRRQAAPAGRIRLAALNALSPARARNLLRHELRLAGSAAPDTRWIDEALRQLASLSPQAAICVRVGAYALHAYRGELYLVHLAGRSLPQALAWHAEASVPWAGGRVLCQPTIGQGLGCDQLSGGVLRLLPRSGGERLQPDLRRPRRSLKNLLQEAAIPPWERERLPFLWCGDELAWIGGIGTDSRFACAAGKPGLSLLWTPDV